MLKTAQSQIWAVGIKKSYLEYCNYSIYMSGNISGHRSKFEKRATWCTAQFLREPSPKERNSLSCITNPQYCEQNVGLI